MTDAETVPEAEEDIVSYGMKFGQWDVSYRTPPYMMTAVAKPLLEDLKSDTTLSYIPHAYLQYCSEIGPGRLGKYTIYGITSFKTNYAADFRYHTEYLQQKFNKEEFQESIRKIHSFPLNELVVFARDTDNTQLWFGWRLRKGNNIVDDGVYVIFDSEKSPPPRIICENFDEFLEQICTNSLEALNDLEEEGNEDDVDDEEEEEPFKMTFTPFSVPQNTQIIETPAQEFIPEETREETNVATMLQGSLNKFETNEIEEEDTWSE
jgi:hypothetical protein